MDETKLNDFLGRLVADASAIWSAPLIVLGRQLGLYDALAESGPVTAGELADSTGTDSRLLAEWLANQAAGGIVDYDPDTDRFVLPPEHAFVLTDPGSPADPISLVRGGMLVGEDLPGLADALSGTGELAWHQHPSEFYAVSDRIFAAGYRATLVADWIPALDGVEARLGRGATVADVGCGHGLSTIISGTTSASARAD